MGQCVSCLSYRIVRAIVREYLNMFFFFTARKRLLDIERFNFKKA